MSFRVEALLPLFIASQLASAPGCAAGGSKNDSPASAGGGATQAPVTEGGGVTSQGGLMGDGTLSLGGCTLTLVGGRPTLSGTCTGCSPKTSADNITQLGCATGSAAAAQASTATSGTATLKLADGNRGVVGACVVTIADGKPSLTGACTGCQSQATGDSAVLSCTSSTQVGATGGSTSPPTASPAQPTTSTTPATPVTPTSPNNTMSPPPPLNGSAAAFITLDEGRHATVRGCTMTIKNGQPDLTGDCSQCKSSIVTETHSALLDCAYSL